MSHLKDEPSKSLSRHDRVEKLCKLNLLLYCQPHNATLERISADPVLPENYTGINLADAMEAALSLWD